LLRGVSRDWRRGAGVGEVGVDGIDGSLMSLAMAGYFVVVQATVVWVCCMYGWCSTAEHELIEQRKQETSLYVRVSGIST
jgi:hypothetical protein